MSAASHTSTTHVVGRTEFLLCRLRAPTVPRGGCNGPRESAGHSFSPYSVEALLGDDSARLGPFLWLHLSNRDAEAPDVTLQVLCAIGEVAVELHDRFPEDLCTSLACTRAMGFDVLALRELHVHCLRVLAIERLRALVFGVPLATNHDHGRTVGHLRMPKVAFGIEDDEQRFETERRFKPAVGCFGVLIAKGAR